MARLTEAVARMKDPAAMADLVAAAAITEPEARYRVLAEPEVAKRLKLVDGGAGVAGAAALAGAHPAELSGAPRPRPPTAARCRGR